MEIIVVRKEAVKPVRRCWLYAALHKASDLISRDALGKCHRRVCHVEIKSSGSDLDLDSSPPKRPPLHARAAHRQPQIFKNIHNSYSHTIQTCPTARTKAKRELLKFSRSKMKSRGKHACVGGNCSCQLHLADR